MGADTDLLIVGGGITGLSLAVHAARAGQRVALVEAGGLGGESTQRSGALVRTHYPDPDSARLALRGLEHFERFEAIYGGPSGFRRTGFAYVPELEEVADGTLDARMEMLRGLGVDTDLLDAPRLSAVDPSIDLGAVPHAAYEPRSGYADPAATCATLASAATRAGAELRAGAPVDRLLVDGSGAVTGARLAGGEEIRVAETVLCAGARSASLCGGLGLALPVRPTAVKLAFFRRRVADHLTVIDAPGGIYLRAEGADATLVGLRTFNDEPLETPDSPLPEVDAGFVDSARQALSARLPSAEDAALIGSRAGMLDMTPDGVPLVGPSGMDGLWLCCGWSGTGFKTGPAVGEMLASWIVTGTAPRGFGAFDPGREMRDPVGVRSPH